MEGLPSRVAWTLEVERSRGDQPVPAPVPAGTGAGTGVSLVSRATTPARAPGVAAPGRRAACGAIRPVGC